MNAKLGSVGRLTLAGWLLNQLDLSGFTWRTKNSLWLEVSKSKRGSGLRIIDLLPIEWVIFNRF
jgi:hypothetical protein